jgi:lysylphosphatidylglycerol synthetase-like protein (DUF2156 family)
MDIEVSYDIADIMPLAERWVSEAKADDFGLDVDMDVLVSVMYVAMVDDEPVGFMVVVVFDSYMGKQKIAVEKYWYCLREHPLAGARLYTEAIKWAGENGCSHFIAAASHLSDRHDSTARLLEWVGARAFEQSYIMELN